MSAYARPSKAVAPDDSDLPFQLDNALAERPATLHSMDGGAGKKTRGDLRLDPPLRLPTVVVEEDTRTRVRRRRHDRADAQRWPQRAGGDEHCRRTACPSIVLSELSNVEADPMAERLREACRRLFPDGWSRRTRFSNYTYPERLKFFVLSAAFAREDYNILITASLKETEDGVGFVRALKRFVEMHGGRRHISYLALSATVPRRHIHIVVSLPKGSRERELVQDFLCKREGISRFGLWQSRGRNQPLHGAHCVAITVKRRGYDGLAGLAKYLIHHFRDAERALQQRPSLHVSDDVRRRAVCLANGLFGLLPLEVRPGPAKADGSPEATAFMHSIQNETVTKGVSVRDAALLVRDLPVLRDLIKKITEERQCSKREAAESALKTWLIALWIRGDIFRDFDIQR